MRRDRRPRRSDKYRGEHCSSVYFRAGAETRPYKTVRKYKLSYKSIYSVREWATLPFLPVTVSA